MAEIQIKTFENSIKIPEKFGKELVKTLKTKGINVNEVIKENGGMLKGKPTTNYTLKLDNGMELLLKVQNTDKKVIRIFVDGKLIFSTITKSVNTLKADKIAEHIEKTTQHKQLQNNFKGMDKIKKVESEELQKRIEELKSENEALKKEIQELENQLGDTNE